MGEGKDQGINKRKRETGSLMHFDFLLLDHDVGFSIARRPTVSGSWMYHLTSTMAQIQHGRLYTSTLEDLTN